MKKYVITGGGGFIGSALVRALLARNDGTVAVIDNFSTGRQENLAEVASQVEMHVADICDFDAIAPIVSGADTVFHIAAIPSVPRSISDPVPSHRSNIDGTFNVLLAAKDGKARKVVYAASSSAYGDTAVLPKVESMQANPKSPYAAQKLLGEYYCGSFAECYGLDATALRFFNVYGPRQDPSSPYSGVLSIFIRCLLERTSPTIFGFVVQPTWLHYVLLAKIFMSVRDTIVRAYMAGAGDPGFGGLTFRLQSTCRPASRSSERCCSGSAFACFRCWASTC